MAEDEDQFEPWCGEIPWSEPFEHTPGAATRIEYGSLRAFQWIKDHAHERILDRKMIAAWHQTMFGEVFPRAAGIVRGTTSHVSVEIDIGSVKRGVPYKDASRELDDCLAKLYKSIVSLDENITHPLSQEHFESILHIACWAHCEMVRIHPFCDGNGRVSRLCLIYLAQRYGLRSTPLPTDEDYQSPYHEAVRLYLLREPPVMTAIKDFFRPLLQRL